MTEAEWLESTDAKRMLDFLGDKATNRKYRLFACACVRRCWPLLSDERSRNAVAQTSTSRIARHRPRLAARTNRSHVASSKRSSSGNAR